MNEVIDPIATKVLSRLAAAEDAGAQAMAHVAERIRACIDIGELLVKKKEELGHGHFLTWFEQQIANDDEALRAGFEVRTAQRYMKLHALSARGLIDLEKAASIRQAYQLAGIMPISDSDQSSSSESGQPTLLVKFRRLETMISSELSRRPIDLWSKEERKALADRLRPFVEVYRQLTP